MVLPLNHDPSQYAKKDPLSFAKGAFEALTLMLNDIKVVRQGGTFAINASFPWLVFGRAIQDVKASSFTEKNRWLKAIYQDATYKFQRGPENATLFLPAPSAAGVATINASAGVGGGVHEAGHAICDCANGSFPTYEQFRSKVGRHLDMTIPYHESNLPKWVNVTADMRLEPGMSLAYPEVEHRFHAIQTWCHDLEKEVRGQQVPSDFLMALRDSGKGWVSDESKAVYDQYQQDARDLVDYLKPIWSELKPRNTDWVESAHLPVYVAVEVINALHNLLKDPPPKGKGKGKGKGQGQGQGEGKGEGDPQEGDPQEGDPQREAGKSPMSVEDIKRLLDGEGEALDPNSAMEQDVNKNKAQLDHELYIPNGAKPMYRKLI